MNILWLVVILSIAFMVCGCFGTVWQSYIDRLPGGKYAPSEDDKSKDTENPAFQSSHQIPAKVLSFKTAMKDIKTLNV